MGTWDFGPFENDGAMVPLSDLEHGDIAAVERCLRAAIGEADYLEVDEGQAAIAAAALVAAAGGADLALPQRARDVLEAHGAAIRAFDLHFLAHEAVDRVLAAGSELAELWDEGSGGKDWRQSLAILQQKLGGNR